MDFIYVKNCPYPIEGKAELQNDFWQEILKKNYKEQRQIKCGCKADKDLWLAVSFLKKTKSYYLSTYPKLPHTHKTDCIFSNNKKELYDPEAGFNFKIFKDPEKLNYQDDIADEEDEQKTDDFVDFYNRQKTYYDFCNEWIKQANAFAFNSVNKDFDRFKKNYTYEEFMKRFIATKIKINGLENGWFDIGKNDGYYVKFGVITCDLIEEADKNFFYKEGVKFNTITPFEQKDFKVPNKRLNIALKKVKIFNNYIKPPYFFISILFYGVAIRLFLYPILFDKKNIVFVESNKEREYAQKLLDNNNVFIKPIGSEFLTLSRKKMPFLNTPYRPDFIVFGQNSDNIYIIEVSGDMGEDYEKLLTDKEKNYRENILRDKRMKYKRV